MPKFRVRIARTVEEYATVTVEAPDAEEAEKLVATTLADENCGQEYCDLANGASWDPGDCHDSRVIDVTDQEDE